MSNTEKFHNTDSGPDSLSAQMCDSQLQSIADKISAFQKQYLLQADGRATRRSIVDLFGRALSLHAFSNPGFEAKARILVAMSECGVEWSDGLEGQSPFREIGHTALEALAIGLARDMISASDQLLE